ncbi:serine/threonine-protein kinase [Amycolatopsis suaedae]
MGIVWRAVDERLERTVAVKQILPQPGLSEAERENSRQRAMREARNAAKFQHPNAIVVFDIAEHEGEPCLVMEYLPSRSLAAVLAEQITLPLPQVARIGEQVASALVAAHRAGIVHRDIKPGNILLDNETGTTKIVDFGISRAAGDLTLTATGLIGGTPAYLAPELARGADPAPSSDVFALGATLYQALEGQAPYGNSTNQLALLYKAANGKIEPPRKSGAATDLLMSLLRVEPDERPTMLETRERFAALASGDRVTPAAAGPATLVGPPLSGPVGGRQPATPASGAPVAPWKRSTNGAAPATTQAPAAPPPSAAAPVRPAAPPTKSANGKRNGILAGAGVAAVAVIALVVYLVLSSGNDGEKQPPQAGGAGNSPAPATSQPQVPPASSSQSPAYQVGQTPSEGPVNGAVALVDGFLRGLTEGPSGWDKLTPAVQKLFGSQADYNAFWAGKLPGYNSIKNPANAGDGSQNVPVNVDMGNGPQPQTIRVVNVGGRVLIDTDIRFGRSSAPQQ